MANNGNGLKVTSLGLLPTDWNVKPIKDVAKVLRAGGTPNRGTPEYYGGDIPFVKIEDISNASTYLTNTIETITHKGLENSSAWVVPPGTVLLAMYGSIGKVAITSIPVATNQAIMAIVPKPEISHEYLYYSLLYFGRELPKYNIQSTQKNINKGIVERFELPIPPLPEQRAIAHVLSTVRQAIESTERVIAAARELKRSMMKYLFTYGPVPIDQANQMFLVKTNIGDLSSEFRLDKLGSVISSGPQNGIYKPLSEYGDGIPIVRINDYENEGGVITSAENRVKLSLEEVKKFRLSTNDLLVNRVNSLTHIGKTALVGELAEPIVFESNMMKFSVNSMVALPRFIFRYLTYESTREQIRSMAKRAVAQSSINQGDLTSILYPVFPLEYQAMVSDILDAVDKKIRIEVSRRDILNKFFESLLHNILTGKVRIQQ